jgi:uncharacterized protein (PEP-CTERM system associated)
MAMRRALLFTIALGAATLLRPAAAAAQETNLVPTPEGNPQAPAGWSFTPSFAYSGAWDDNVLVRGTGDTSPHDFLNVVNPRGTADYNGRRGQMSASYDGAFLLYRDLGSLDSYDQHAWFFGRRMLSRHVALFVRNTAASVPTTELSQFIGIPFVRTGSRLDSLKGGMEIVFTKRTSLAAGYDFEWVDFDQSQPGAERLRGGHSHGGSANLRHTFSERLALVADVAMQHAIVATINEVFDVQNASAGVEFKLSELTRVFATAGVSHLVQTETATSRTGPAVRIGLSRHFRTADVDLGYSRSFVPSYGFGGTMQNEETNVRVRVPLARRVYTAGGLSWRRNDPLVDIEPPLRSLWIEATLGYAMTPWARLEGFYASSRQTVDRPGGEADRNRVGFQVVTSKPVRIQ